MSDRPVLSSAAQLDAVKLVRELVPVPEWGMDVWVYELTGEELDGWRQYMLRTSRNRQEMNVDPKKLRGQTARLVCLAVRDENGQRIFADMDASMLMRKGSGAIERIANVARRLSRVIETEDETDDLGNDSGPTLNGSSNSDSPATSVELSPSY